LLKRRHRLRRPFSSPLPQCPWRRRTTMRRRRKKKEEMKM
jgi:hypothetical protein